LALLRHTYLRSFVLDPEDVGSLSLGAFWNFSKKNGAPMTWTWGYKAQRAYLKDLHAQGQKG